VKSVLLFFADVAGFCLRRRGVLVSREYRLLLPYPARESAVKSREKRENESKKAGSLSLRAPASVKIYLVPRKGL
jgi:hypothetical protein